MGLFGLSDACGSFPRTEVLDLLSDPDLYPAPFLHPFRRAPFTALCGLSVTVKNIWDLLPNLYLPLHNVDCLGSQMPTDPLLHTETLSLLSDPDL